MSSTSVVSGYSGGKEKPILMVNVASGKLPLGIYPIKHFDPTVISYS